MNQLSSGYCFVEFLVVDLSSKTTLAMSQTRMKTVLFHCMGADVTFLLLTIYALLFFCGGFVYYRSQNIRLGNCKKHFDSANV